MIEVIQDGREHEALIYTDDTPTAMILRKAFAAEGAVYSGKSKGYSWRMPKRVAILTLKKFGFKYDLQRHIENEEVTDAPIGNIAQEGLFLDSRPNAAHENETCSESIFG